MFEPIPEHGARHAWAARNSVAERRRSCSSVYQKSIAEASSEVPWSRAESWSGIKSDGRTMKNALEVYASESGFGELYCMNALQDAGVISDNAVTAKDVCTSDCAKAVEFLRGELF